MITLPRDVVRRWHLDEIHYVVIDIEPGALRIRPLADAELRDLPTREEEVT